MLGGLTNALLRALARLDLADLYRRLAHSDLCAQRRLSADPRRGERFLRRQARGAGGRGRLARLRRAADQCRSAPRRHPDARARQGLPAEERRLQFRSVAARPRGLPDRNASGRHRRRRIAARVDEMLAHKPGGTCRRRRHSAATAEFLHRLPGAAGVCRHQTRAARDRADAYLAPTSAAIRSRPLRRFRSATRSSATACRSPAPPRSARTWRSGRSR